MNFNRREFFKTTALGTTGLALSPSFSHLVAATVPAAAAPTLGGFPHRFIFIRKSNGNLPEQFNLPQFSRQVCGTRAPDTE